VSKPIIGQITQLSKLSDIVPSFLWRFHFDLAKGGASAP